jgi:hypothetical protein
MRLLSEVEILRLSGGRFVMESINGPGYCIFNVSGIGIPESDFIILDKLMGLYINLIITEAQFTAGLSTVSFN